MNDKYDPWSGRNKTIGMNEPRQYRQPKIIGAQAVIEMMRRVAGKVRTLGENRLIIFCTFSVRRNGIHENACIIILTQRPSVFEKRINKNHDQQKNFNLPHERRGNFGEGNLADDGRWAVVIAEHAHKANQDKNSGVGKKRDTALEVADHDRVDGSVVPAYHFTYPLQAVAVSDGKQAFFVLAFMVGKLGVANPA